MIEERTIDEFHDSIHFVGVSQIKGDLNIFVGIFNDDQPVVVDIRAFPFAFRENGAPFGESDCF